MRYPAVIPNLGRCKEVAGALSRIRLPPELVRQRLSFSDRKAVGNFNLIVVAICHQTQKISGTVDGRWYRGWDYLEQRLDAHCRNHPGFLEMENLATLSYERLEQALSPSPLMSAFSDVKARAGLVNELGRHMLRSGYDSLAQLCDNLKGRCIGPDSITSFLKATAAYSDPNEKKARLLIGLLRDAHGWEFSDAHKLGPPVDYHEIRGHLRIGTVIVREPGFKPQGEAIADADDNIVRAAIAEAIVAIAQELPGKDALHVHYVLWNYFRALCRRDDPICCKGGAISESELDPMYVLLFQKSIKTGGCIFSSFCDSFKRKVFPVEYNYGGTYY